MGNAAARSYVVVFLFILAVVLAYCVRTPVKPGMPVIQRLPVSESARSAGDMPFVLPPGFSVRVYATGLGSPRDLAFSPGGTLVVSDPVNNAVLALPDGNRDGVSDTTRTVLTDGSKTHGIAFYDGRLFVASERAVTRYDWNEGTKSASDGTLLFSLPPNGNHGNRTLAFGPDGTMYVSLGSTCNACVQSPETGGSVLVSDATGIKPRVYATGLRNAAFLAVNPATGELWGTEMGRDYLGDDLPPDELNIIRNGTNYGWPYCYGNGVHDDAFDPQNTRSCEKSARPIWEIPAHSAPLGLTFIVSRRFPKAWNGDLLVAYHGSWNRTSPAGFKIVRLTVRGSSVTDSQDFMTGFNPGPGNGDAVGRPVDLAFDTAGSLFISDDKAGKIYIIRYFPL